MSIFSAVYRQFRRPSGILGYLAGWIMANRLSNRARNRWTISLLGIKPGDRVLEIGFGPGIAIELAARKASAGVVVGVDHSPVMLRQAMARNRAAVETGRIRLHCGGLELLSGFTEPFDKVYSVNVVQFLPDRLGALAAIKAVLRRGGTIATTYQPRHRGATRNDAFLLASELAEDMRKTGYRAIRSEELPLTPLPAVCVLGEA